MSVLMTGRGRAGGGGGEYLTEIFFSLRNVPGVLKRQKKKIIFWGGGGGGGGEKFLSFFSLLIFFFQKCSWGSETHANKNLFFGGGGGGFWGVWGAPRPHPGVARGRKTIHFFL